MAIFHKTEVQTVILRCLTGLNLEFWKYDSWFPSEESKLTSVRNKLKLSLKYWFFEAKVGIWVCYGPKKWSKYLVDTIKTTFCKDKDQRAILVKKQFFSCLKMHHFSVVLPKWVLLAQMEISCHIFKTQDSDPLSTSKWPSEPQFCERWPYICQKNGQKWL